MLQAGRLPWKPILLSFLMIVLPWSGGMHGLVDVEEPVAFEETILDARVPGAGPGFSAATFVNSGTFFSSSHPVETSVGYHHTCVLLDNGELACSGYNYHGQLGIGKETPSPHDEENYEAVLFPEAVNIVEVAAGWYSTCALDDQHRVWCWGDNNGNQLGTDSTQPYVRSPELVNGLDHVSVVELLVGIDHRCVLDDIGGIYCWGSNAYGQLGTGSHNGWHPEPKPVYLPGNLTTTTLGGKGHFTCALSNEGSVFCWGQNNGFLGAGTTENSPRPTQVLLPFSDKVNIIKVGHRHSCALVESGSMYCWGYNTYGQLGTESTWSNANDALVPVKIEVTGSVMAFDVGYEHTCVVLTTQDVTCWGLNNQQQLGMGSTTASSDHQNVNLNYGGSTFSGLTNLNAGVHTTCAVFENGNSGCWGANAHGQMGTGSKFNNRGLTYSQLRIGSPTQDLRFDVGENHTVAPFVSGMNVSSSVQPPLPNGFAFDNATGKLAYNGQGTVGQTLHNITFRAATDTVVLPITVNVVDEGLHPGRTNAHLGGLSLGGGQSSSRISSISSVNDHTCITHVDHSPVCWGDGASYRLGTGSTNVQTIPVVVQSNKISKASFAVAGTEHTCYLTGENDVHCVGAYEGVYGQVSNPVSNPVALTDRSTGLIKTMATQTDHSCYLLKDGDVHCWGDNDNGELGRGYTNSYATSASARVNLPSSLYATSVAVGDDFSCALMNNRSVMCWGANNFGQLGNGQTGDSLIPVLVNLSRPALAINAGMAHACALLDNHSLECWGRNNLAQLGDNTLTDRSNPIPTVLPAGVEVVQFSAGTSHTCAVTRTQALYCWGLNANGQLGDGTTTFAREPTLATMPTGLGAAMVATGDAHTCVISTASNVYCVGSNDKGQLGDGTTSNSQMYVQTQHNARPVDSYLQFVQLTPFTKSLTIAGWGPVTYSASALPAGLYLLESGTLVYDASRPLQNQTITMFATNQYQNISLDIQLLATDFSSQPGTVPSHFRGLGLHSADDTPGVEEVIQIESGRYHGCLITGELLPKCWGYNTQGSLGTGDTSTRSTPVTVRVNNMGEATTLTSGGFQTCAVNSEGELWCWGIGSSGQLGHGINSASNVPVKVEGIRGSVVQVSASEGRTCALDSFLEVYCWGVNSYGEGGFTPHQSSNTAKLVPALANTTPTMIGVGVSHTCALFDNGTIACFGRAASGLMGDNSTVESGTALRWPTLPPGKHAIAMDVGFDHTCALMGDLSVYCWGVNSYGEVGNGQTTPVLTPTEVLNSSHEVIGITLDAHSSCAWSRNGTAFCWGWNVYGTLGVGNTTNMNQPTTVLDHSMNPEAKIVDMDNGYINTCAVYDNGGVSCWGRNDGSIYGNGDGTGTDRLRPTTYVSGFEPYLATEKTNVVFITGQPTNSTLKVAGWNVTVSLNSTLPSGLMLNLTTLSMQYDGSPLGRVNFTLALTDFFGTRELQINASSITVLANEGRVPGNWMHNGSVYTGSGKVQHESISLGQNHACMADIDGGMQCWGIGSDGRLATGGTTQQTSPTPYSEWYDGPSEIGYVSSGNAHSCALDGSQHLFCWGSSDQYQNGVTTGSEYRATRHTQDHMYQREWAMISAGGLFTCGIAVDATVWCWGDNNHGQLGYGVTNDKATAQQVQLPEAVNATSLSAGGEHVCALTDNGDVYCWGRNIEGQLGLGNTTSTSLPLKAITPTGKSVSALSAGQRHTCAIFDDGTVGCWGQNTYGQLGDGTTDDRSTPSTVILAGQRAPLQISSGDELTCLLFDDASIQCWGRNDQGQLGTGNTIDSTAPQSLDIPAHLSAYSISVGERHACALFHDGVPRCWGYNGYGNLGIGSTTNQNTPSALTTYEINNNTYTAYAGFEHHLPFHIAGWGQNATLSSQGGKPITWNQDNQTLRVGSSIEIGLHSVNVTFTNSGYLPLVIEVLIEIDPIVDRWADRGGEHFASVAVIDTVDHRVPVEIEVGNNAVCYTTMSDVNYCKGTNSQGQLGVGHTSAVSTPTQVRQLDQPLQDISMGNSHTCGLDATFSLWCWGYNQYGQLGIGSTAQQTQPQPITLDASGAQLGLVQQVDTGASGHSCAIIDDSTYCWGRNDYGQLGIGSTSNQNRPSTTGESFTDIALGDSHTCGITNNGSVYCWGRNNHGQLGLNSTDDQNIPNHVQLPPNASAVAIAAGKDHTCTLLSNRSMYCWGYNAYGQVGDSTTSQRNSPSWVHLSPTDHPIQINAGQYHTCGLLNNGSVQCWGYNANNQVEGGESNELSTSVATPYHVNITQNGKFVSIDAGVTSVCGITMNADIHCWGGSTAGRIESIFTKNTSAVGYISGHVAQKKIVSMGWGINHFDFTSLPTGYNYTDSVLRINANAAPTPSLDWTAVTVTQTVNGSIDVQERIVNLYSGSSDAWTNNLHYLSESNTLPFSDVDTASSHACGINIVGMLYCWGYNDYGKLGDGTTARKLSPNLVRFDDPTQRVIKVATGYENTCAITDEHRIMCWGRNSNGELGIGTTVQSSIYNPVEVLMPWSSEAVDIAVGQQFACAVKNDGTIWCWGDNYYKQLGNGSAGSTPSKTPVQVDLPEGRFAISISSSDKHTCAIIDDGSVFCWGYYVNGNMGFTGSAGSVYPPKEVPLPRLLRAVTMDVGTTHGCAAMSDDSLWCWGRNNYGQAGLGYISGTNAADEIVPPAKLDIQSFQPIIDISADYWNTCALHGDGTLTCWGRNNQGQVGDGTTNDISNPTVIQLDGSSGATFVSVGNEFSCAGADDGVINCWGKSSVLGDGSTEPTTFPVKTNINEPEYSSVLTILEGETTVNRPYISGWNYTVASAPPLPVGFTLDSDTGIIRSNSQVSFGVTRHNITVNAGPFSVTTELTFAVIRDTDSDGIPDTEDYDDDDDTHLDSLDNCPVNFGTSVYGGYVGCPDADGDGWADLIDPFVDDITQWKDTDGDGYGDNPNGTSPDVWILDASQWYDSDEDGYGDNEFGTRGDACPTIEGNSTLDRFGCVDNDGDGWSDDGDAFPLESSQYVDRDGDGWGDNQTEGAALIDVFPSDGTQWNDTDGDGRGDNRFGTEGDWFPEDPTRWADTDRDGVADEDDAFVNDASQSTDRDGDLYGDDPLGNRPDEFPDDPNEWKDTDGDGVGNNADDFPFDPTQTTDRDGDGYGDNPLGSGADLFPDNPTQWEDRDEDGLGDNTSGTDADPYLNDFDNDGYNDSIDVLPSFYSPGDLDNDGVPDEEDWAPSDYREWADFDNDGKGDNEDTDDDNDGYSDTDEVRLKTDPFSSGSVPVESFEIVIPGTNVGLGAWDLIGIFGGVPFFAWIGFGFVTRNKRCARYEVMLHEAESRKALENVALKWEYSLMLRLLGPHQGIRLERIRAELDDVFEIQEASLAYTSEDQTPLVTKQLPQIHTHNGAYDQDAVSSSDAVGVSTEEPTTTSEEAAAGMDIARANSLFSEPTAVAQPAPEVALPAAQKLMVDRSAWIGSPDGAGYEWYMHEGRNHYRLENTQDDWIEWQD